MKDPKEEAQNTPEDQREDKAAEYLLKSAKNQKKAAKQLNQTLEDTDNTFKSLLDKAQPQDYVLSTINEAQKLLREARKGGDINDIVSKIKSLGNASKNTK
jgi:ribosomal 50S subunit-associated protein YjgA (DUF615 family)